LDEGIYLDRLFFNLKTKTNIAKSFGQLFHSYNCYNDYHASRIFKDLILKSTKIITQEKNIKSFKNKIISILSKYDVKNDNWGYWKEMIVNFGLDRFIIETLKAEYEILENLITSKGIFKNYFLISADGISDIVTNNNYKLIIKVIEDELIKINEAIRIYEFIENKDKKIAEEIQKIIKKKGGVIDTDYEKKQEDIIIEKNRNFELLFNQEKFKKNILKFFAKKEEIELPWNDIPDWYKDNIYFNNDVRVEFLRDLLKGLNVRTVKKIDVIEKLNNNLDWYLVREIFQRKHQLNYNLNKNQILFLNDWVKKEASKLNFRDAIYKVQNSSFSINQNCLTIYKYIKELNIKVDKKTSLDLLSYNDIDSISSNYNDNYSNYFEKLVNQINDFQSVKSRVYENLKNKIKYSTLLNNHIIFSFKYNLIENYKLIEDLLTEFLPELQVGRFHDNPLLVYYDKSKNFEFIKINFPQEVTDLFWAIIDYLIENNEHIKFVEEKLLLNIDKTEDYNEKLKFSNKLLKIHSKNALSKFYTILHYIKENQLKGQFRLHDFNKSIHDYKNAEIETAVNLLELSYKYEFDNFENPAREVSAYLKRMIVEDKENYDKIKNLISEVINLNRGKIENIQFLEYELNNLKEAFYSNYKSNYTLKDALKIISKIEN
jgi:signal recognition particle subunit SEC65